MKSIHDPRYVDLIEKLIELRKDKQVTQTVLADTLGRPQSYITKIENLERRLDLIELYDWLNGLDCEVKKFLTAIKWI